MQRRHLLRSGLFLTGAAAAGSLVLVSEFAQPRRTARESTGIADWINTAMPISLTALRGKVVLVNFWRPHARPRPVQRDAWLTVSLIDRSGVINGKCDRGPAEAAADQSRTMGRWQAVKQVTAHR
jgi:hypothetical protein